MAEYSDTHAVKAGKHLARNTRSLYDTAGLNPTRVARAVLDAVADDLRAEALEAAASDAETALLDEMAPVIAKQSDFIAWLRKRADQIKGEGADHG